MKTEEQYKNDSKVFCDIKKQVPLIVLDKTMKDNHSKQLMNEELFYRAINR